MEVKQTELEQSQAKIKELERDRTTRQQTEKSHGWGQTSSNWGDKSQSGWGRKSLEKTKNKMEEICL